MRVTESRFRTRRRWLFAALLPWYIAFLWFVGQEMSTTFAVGVNPGTRMLGFGALGLLGLLALVLGVHVTAERLEGESGS